MAKHEPSDCRAHEYSGLRSATVTAALSLGVLVVGVAPGALPSWGDTTTRTGIRSAPGVLDLQIGGMRESAQDPADVTFALDALVPGDSNAVPVTLTNAGDAMFTYSATAVSAGGGSGGDLSPALRFSVVVGGSVAGGPRTGSCIGGATSFGPSPLASSASEVIPPSSGPILPGETQSICIVVALPETTGNSAQGDTAEATIVFRAVEVT